MVLSHSSPKSSGILLWRFEMLGASPYWAAAQVNSGASIRHLFPNGLTLSWCKSEFNYVVMTIKSCKQIINYRWGFHFGIFLLRALSLGWPDIGRIHQYLNIYLNKYIYILIYIWDFLFGINFQGPIFGMTRKGELTWLQKRFPAMFCSSLVYYILHQFLGEILQYLHSL